MAEPKDQGIERVKAEAAQRARAKQVAEAHQLTLSKAKRGETPTESEQDQWKVVYATSEEKPEEATAPQVPEIIIANVTEDPATSQLPEAPPSTEPAKELQPESATESTEASPDLAKNLKELQQADVLKKRQERLTGSQTSLHSQLAAKVGPPPEIPIGTSQLQQFVSKADAPATGEEEETDNGTSDEETHALENTEETLTKD